MRTAMKVAFDVALESQLDLVPSAEDVAISNEEKWLLGDESLADIIGAGLRALRTPEARRFLQICEERQDIAELLFASQERTYN